jgi:hypothetical protein
MLLSMRCISCLLGLLALAASGCAPTYELGVQPATPRTLFASGQPQVEAAADGVALGLRFLGYEPEWLVFEVEYHNDSNQPVIIEPASFASVPLRVAAAMPVSRRIGRGERVPAVVAAASQHAPWPALPPQPLPALDPAPSISQLEAGASQAAARASRPDWVGLALFAVALGTDIAGSTRRSETRSQAQSCAAIHDIAWAYSAVSTTNRVRHAGTAAALAQRAEQLRTYALQRTQLLPGQQVRGYVYLPRFDAADRVQVLAPLGHGPVALDFVQTHQRR